MSLIIKPVKMGLIIKPVKIKGSSQNQFLNFSSSISSKLIPLSYVAHQ